MTAPSPKWEVWALWTQWNEQSGCREADSDLIVVTSKSEIRAAVAEHKRNHEGRTGFEISILEVLPDGREREITNDPPSTADQARQHLAAARAALRHEQPEDPHAPF